MKKLLSLVLFLGLIISTGCSDDDEKVDTCGQLEAVTNALVETGLTYAFDPTVANCQAYTEALEEWLNVARNCDQVDQTEIDEIESDLENLDCAAA